MNRPIALLVAVGLLCVQLSCSLAILSLVSHAVAADLRIGSKTLPSSLDPHYHNSGENSALLPHIYDSLVVLDTNLQIKPALATHWRLLSNRVWELDLRQDVRFHDGSPFSAKDVAYTFKRIPLVRNSPGSYAYITRQVARVEIVDPYKIRLHTHKPHPSLMHDLTVIMILPAHLGEQVESSAFNTGEAAIGTGPYRYQDWVPGQHFSLQRNSTYWAAKPTWDKVIMTAIASDPTRIAALLNNEIDIADSVPLADRQSLASNAKVKLHSAPAAQVMYIYVDSARRISPHVRDIHGRALDKNPLQDKKVRRALSLALDRQAIVTYLLDGAGVPAAQILPAIFAGSSGSLLPEKQDIEGARQLLAEAGYPQGFRLVLHSPSDRYPNDAKVAQAIAQMWWKIGVITEVETQTRNIFFPAAARQQFSAYFSGWGETSVLKALVGLVHSYDADRGLGAGNRARYQHPQVDELIEQAMITLDEEQRIAILEQAQRIAFREDQGIIALYHPSFAWATGKHISYQANSQGFTRAMLASPKASAP